MSIDDIIAAADVARMTLYAHFQSKDHLATETVRSVCELWRRRLAANVQRLSNSPAEQLLRVFDALDEWFSEPGFRGCIAMNFALEITDRTHRACVAAMEHKRLFRDYLRSLAEQIPGVDSRSVSDQAFVLVEGAIAAAVIWKTPRAAQVAGLAMRAILRAYKRE